MIASGLGAPPRFPTVRLYKAYEPWGRATVEEALEARGWMRGVSLFVHPVRS